MLPLARTAERPYIKAYVLNALGTAHGSNGSAEEAIAVLTDAAELRARIEDRPGHAESLLRLSQALAAADRTAEAAAVWSQASVLVDEVGSARLVELRAELVEPVVGR